MPVNFLEAIMGMHVDHGGFEADLKKAETTAEGSAKKIAGSFSTMAVGIAAALATLVLVGLERAIKKTAEYGLEMEHLGDRLGMTAQQASNLTGILERQGIEAGTAARAFQIMAMEAKQTTEAIDPFTTKLGRTLGTLRDTQGNLLNTGQIFDLARKKIQEAGNATEQLQVAQQIFGARMAGQLLPVLKLSNEEWAKQRAAVEDAMGNMNEASEAALEYKKSTADLDQALRGIEIAIGTAVLPAISKFIDWTSRAVKAVRDDFSKSLRAFGGGDVYDLVGKLNKMMDESGQKRGQVLEDNSVREEKIVKLMQEQVHLAEEAAKFGIGTRAAEVAAVQAQLEELTKQRELYQRQLADPTVDSTARLAIEIKLEKNRVEAAQTVAKLAADQYRDEELQAKAVGAYNLSTEIELLQKRLADERTVGEERLKLEAEIYQKRKQFLEEAFKVGRELGILTVNQEIAYRKSKATELAGKGDVLGAAQEVAKIQKLAMEQADAVFNFTKKIQVVSLQSEIEFQRQKLEVVRGNAQEEMKIIGQIADLDKQLYDKRLQFNLTYTQSIVEQYNKIMDAAKKTGEVETFERAKVTSERQLVEATREARGVLAGGGTVEQRQAAVEFAQFVYKQVEQMQQLGKEVSGIWKDAAGTAKDILKAATGGEEVRAPGGPSPVVGSLLGPVEGLATQGLARGSDIPRLDTSFTDLATRLRDVLNTNVLNLTNFATAVGDAFKRISAVTGVQFNAGAVAPGGNIVAAGTPGQPAQPGGGTATVAPGGVPVTPSPQVGVGASSDVVTGLRDLKDSIDGGLSDLRDSLQTQAAQNQEQIAAAIDQVRQARESSGVNVNVTLDPNTGDLLVNRITRELAP